MFRLRCSPLNAIWIASIGSEDAEKETEARSTSMRRASSGRESRHRLFTGCAMMAECPWTGCALSSGPSIEYTVESIAHRGGNRGSSSSTRGGSNVGTRNTIVECGQVLEQDCWIAWLRVNREEDEGEEEEEEEEKTKSDNKGVAGATTGAGVGLPLLLLVVALLDDLTHATTAAPVVLESLNSAHPADVTTPVYLPSRSYDYPFAPRPFRRAIKRASSPNDVGAEGHANQGTLDHLTLATRLSPSSAPPLTSPLSLTSPLLLTPPLSSSSSPPTLSSPSPSLTPLNTVVVVRHRDISVLTTPSHDNENEGIAARRGRAKRASISNRSKLKDQPSPNFIDPWSLEAWRRVNEHPPQSRKVEPVLSIDEGIRPAVQTFTPLLEPVFKFGESILRPESSLRDILLHESASKTTATTTTAVVATAGTIARNIAYLGVTQRAGSIVPEKNDVGRVTEDRVRGDKSGKKLVLVGNENNGAVVGGGGSSVIEWTTTTVAGPMSSSRSAFSGDDVQVAERVRVRASSERSSSKGEEDDEEQIKVTIARDNEDSFTSSTSTTTTTTQHPPLTQDTSMEARKC
ncbi:Uncharacterized protein DBV15_08690 [Temnothorax longispinosus]|uniref:Uncharacterized protein n=1 Tax=Temnothorax longispinosus TaxID=300112 RepID=A0A4S2KHY5_9HYME|nr:Uncharacterized protein DBV15_08690 [Temnothorax longispinosus]